MIGITISRPTPTVKDCGSWHNTCPPWRRYTSTKLLDLHSTTSCNMCVQACASFCLTHAYTRARVALSSLPGHVSFIKVTNSINAKERLHAGMHYGGIESSDPLEFPSDRGDLSETSVVLRNLMPAGGYGYHRNIRQLVQPTI